MNPVITLLSIALIPAALAYFNRIYPGRPLVLLACVPAVMSAGLISGLDLTRPLAALDVALVVLAAVDLFTLPTRGALVVERQVVRIMSLGKPQRVSLVVSNRTARCLRVAVRDDRSEDLEAEPVEFVARLGPRSRATFQYQLTARRRGAFRLEWVYVSVRSRGGLWQRHFHYAVESPLHVYPDMQQLGQYALLARTDRLNLLGVRRTRRIGQDNEFERLRDYALDDNYKHIDWRSTARRGRLTVKDFQSSQSQRVVFLLDCGRMMTNTSAGLTMLDHALNALLMASYVALRQGDSVGLLAFSDEIHGFVPPRSGMNQMNRLLHASFDRFPRLVESRYDQAFLYLATHCRKRSLVVLITNVIDEVNSSQIERYLRNVSGRHLPMGVLLRDHRLFDAVEGPLDDDAALFQGAAAADTLAWRRQVLTDLEARGVLSLDVFPEQMTAPLVNRYLEIKARHLL